jgi:hypothetical protein
LHHVHLDQIPHHDIALVPIEQHEGTVASDAQGACYDDPIDDEAVQNEGPSQPSNLLQSVVVTNIDMHGSTSAEMTAAAIRHLK